MKLSHVSCSTTISTTTSRRSTQSSTSTLALTSFLSKFDTQRTAYTTTLLPTTTTPQPRTAITSTTTMTIESATSTTSPTASPTTTTETYTTLAPEFAKTTLTTLTATSLLEKQSSQTTTQVPLTTTQTSITVTSSQNTGSLPKATTTIPISTTLEQTINGPQTSSPQATETALTATVALTSETASATTSINSTIETTAAGGQLPKTFLLFTDSILGSIYRMDLDTQTSVKIPVSNITEPIAIDYDPIDENIYFTDIGLDEIRKASIYGYGDETVVDLGSASIVDGIAVDPLSRLIFYTDTGNDLIAVITMDEFDRAVLIDSGLSEPRAITLDMQQGHMYWTDWGNQTISTALYDGSEITNIITTGLLWPNAIALDSQGGRLYWADGGTNKIEVSFLNGSNRQTVFAAGLVFTQFFGLTLHDDFLYYTDWYQLSVLRISINGQNNTVFGPSTFRRLNDIHVHHSSVTGNNICTTEKGGCSHICIPYKGDKKCLCPTGLSLLSDGISCDNSTSTTAVTSAATSLSTSSLDPSITSNLTSFSTYEKSSITAPSTTTISVTQPTRSPTSTSSFGTTTSTASSQIMMSVTSSTPTAPTSTASFTTSTTSFKPTTTPGTTPTQTPYTITISTTTSSSAATTTPTTISTPTRTFEIISTPSSMMTLETKTTTASPTTTSVATTTLTSLSTTTSVITSTTTPTTKKTFVTKIPTTPFSSTTAPITTSTQYPPPTTISETTRTTYPTPTMASVTTSISSPTKTPTGEMTSTTTGTLTTSLVTTSRRDHKTTTNLATSTDTSIHTTVIETTQQSTPIQNMTSTTLTSTKTPSSTTDSVTTTLFQTTTSESTTSSLTTASISSTKTKTTTTAAISTPDVNECDRDNECDVNAACTNTFGSYVCTCQDGFTGNGFSCSVIAQLPLPYGQDGDHDFFQVNEQDECILVENIECGFYVNDTHYERFYICENGIVTFNKAYRSSSVPQSHTTTEFSSFSESLPLAPYFSNIDATNGQGNISYKVYSQGLLQTHTDVKSIVREILNTAHYNTTDMYLVIVVTWENVVEYGRNMTKTSSFQLILVTDGSTTTLAFFAYLDRGMNFESGENFIGFAADSSVASFNFRVNNPEQSFVNLGRSGFLLLQLNSRDDLPTTDCRHCELWAALQQTSTLQSGFQTYWDSMPECPCSRGNINVTNAFALLDSEYFLTNDSLCYGLKSAQLYGEQLGSICCYVNNSYVSQSPNAGFKTIWNPLVTLYKTNYRNTDRIMKQRCCSSGQCDVFYTYRPINNQCANAANVSLGGGTGDPHIRTLDGKQYTFNGHGEYILIDIDHGNFLLQGRTQPYLNKQNVTVGATIFSAFAGEDKVNGGHFMISLNSNGSGMDIVVNDNDLTIDEELLYFSAPDNTLTLDKRDSNTMVLYFTNIGVSVFIDYKIGLLTMSVTMPYKFSGRPRGLMGNANGNSDDDFVARNGTEFGSFPTDRLLFEMGQTWLVKNDNESVFLYPPGSTYRDFQNPYFDVNFLDEASPIKVNEARLYCGEINIPCIFDYVFTGLNTFADETKTSVAELDETAIIIENKAPSISIAIEDLKQDTRAVQVEVGLNKTITINGVDDGTIEFKLSKGEDYVALEEANTTNSIKMILNFTTVDLAKEEISVVAIDNNGVEAPLLVIPIVLCSGCNGRGICDYDTPRQGQIGNSLLVVNCICEPYYEGLDCEFDFDGCFSTPCSLGRNCEDNNATFHQETNKAFTCSGCPVGYQLDVQGNCEDVNECTNVTLNVCEDICINTEGSYRCDCSYGYRVGTRTQCEDINECEEAANDCIQICSNTDGSYECSCYSGYLFNATDNSCTLDVVGICENASCPTVNGGCFVEGNESTCFCFNGYQLFGDSCANINECDQAVCSQKCEDTNGSYLCGCFNGYILNTDKTTCSVCQEDFWGNGCSKECSCSSLGTIRCDHVKGCICNAKWTGLKCETDVNECKSVPNICNNTYKVCVNTPGSYRCECRQGYMLNPDTRICEDYNECEDPEINRCGQLCINTDGGFYCECLSGYTLNADRNSCSDIDECTLGGIGCEQVCSNAVGSYRCVCFYGYLLNNDRRTCRKDTSDNLCVEEGFICEGFCIVGESSSFCGCSPGYAVGTDLQSCLDIDECADPNLNQCGVKENCVNNAGSYQCSCPIGKRLDNDARTCKTCDDFHYGEECSVACNCGIGATTCDSVTGCVCGAGWTGGKCDIDENECDFVPSRCTGENSLCINIPGNFTCICLPGFSLNPMGDCKDIDECSDDKSNNCEQICTNTLGSYQCSCYAGFKQTGTLCQDIDECSTKNDCDQTCLNTIGSYKCSCESGFRLNTDNRKTCIPRDQCSESQTSACDSRSTQCIVVGGNVTCSCRKGYRHLNISHCEDINECSIEEGVCAENCSNTDGEYYCSCGVGFTLDNDLSSCLACYPGTYGNECKNECKCVAANTKTCNPIDGRCDCLDGWTGVHCSQNINECNENTSVCPDNSTCQDTYGAYVCRCDSGFFKDEESSCSGCSETRYGINCAQKCECLAANTASCDPKNGSCTCKNGWTGSNCEEDIEECDAEVGNPCTEQNRRTCRNTNGGFKCDCDTGFEMVNSNCEDKNECLRGESNCTQKCTNTIGGFTCSCNPGYRGTGNNCTVCTSGLWGINCTQNCECNVNNTHVCDPATGCVCKTEYTGLDCKQDVDECSTVRNACPSNSKCTNTYGSFDCTCLSGYKQSNTLSGQRVCIKCTGNTFGSNCSGICDCINEHTFSPSQSCDHKSGQCNCRWQWNGTRCEQDVDECVVGFDTCTKDNETCLNSEGGFKCICEEGFFRNKSGYCIISPSALTVTNGTHDSVLIRIYINITIPLNVNLDDPDTNAIYTTEIQQNLQTAIDDQVDNSQIVVNYLREGSIMIDYTIIYPRDSAAVIGKIIAGFAEGQAIEVFNETWKTIRMNIGDLQVEVGADINLCDIYIVAVGPCQQGYYCDIVNERPLCRKKSEGDMTPLILALGIGIPLLILTAMIATMIICYYRKSRKNKRRSDNLRYVERNTEDADSGVFQHRLPTRFVLPSTSWPAGSERYSFGTNEHYSSEDMSTLNQRHSWRLPGRILSAIDPTKQFEIRRPEFSARHLPRKILDDENVSQIENY